uniref:Uncharacterized protein n=1 Tax=Anguilla anguilla TaxID=7936 RepID=A0A0E9U442_ANGAN
MERVTVGRGFPASPPNSVSSSCSQVPTVHLYQLH